MKIKKINKKTNQNAITLIGLVITIIVLLILANISLNLIMGESGIFAKAVNATEKYRKSEYDEALKLIGIPLLYTYRDTQEYMNRYEEAIKQDTMFKEAKEIAQLEDAEEITIQVITKEGWVYWITEKKIEYKGLEGEVEVIAPTGIWATLEGNTLRFYAEKEAAQNGGGKIYGNVQGKEFVRDNNAETIDTPWFIDKEQIKSVEFMDEIAPEYLSYFFSDLSSLEIVDMEKVKTINVKNMYGMFLNCRKLKEVKTQSFDTRNVENMGWMFLNCNSLSKLDVSSFDTSKVTDMSVMFSGCNNLTQLNLSNFDTQNVTSMRSMFAECQAMVSLDLSNFDTQNVTNMATMFYNCNNLKEVDVSNFDTNNVTDMEVMFYGCNSLIQLNLKNFETGQVTTMSGMFNQCNNLTYLDVTNFNTSNVTNMGYMFSQCQALTELDISSFDTNKVTDMRSMFNTCKNLKTIYVGEKWKLAPTRGGMFTECGTSRVTKK